MYAIRKDGQGYRGVDREQDIDPATEMFSETPPPSPFHRLQNGEWVLDAAQQTADLRAERLAEINSKAASALTAISASCPEGEVQSWPQQTREAEALAADPNAQTPLLTAIATARGLTVSELASRVRAKVSAYTVAAGQAIGQRQALEDRLMAVDLAASDAAAQLEEIQWAAA